MNNMTRLITAFALLLAASPALAYVGPGAGISVLGSIVGILVTIVVAIGAIIMWPLRKAMKKRKAAAAAGTNAETPQDSDPS